MTSDQSALSELQKFVGRFSDGVCYGIEWVLSDSGRLECKSHYNPPWRIEAVKKQGLEHLYTSKSKECTFAPGEGLVGKTFASQQKLFVEDLQTLAVDDMIDVISLSEGTGFLRVEIAKEFGIHSAIFVPTATGVLEAGSTQQVISESDLIKATASCQDISPPGQHSAILEQIVEKSCGGCYGIEWTLSDNGHLKCKSFYNPQWRIEAVQKKGLHGLYTTKSGTYTFRPGEGHVGKAFANQQILFSEDLQTQSMDDMMDVIALADHTGFLRVDLAKEFGIHSAIFMPTSTGVLEVGSTQQVESASALLSSAVNVLDQVVSQTVRELAGLAGK